MQASPAQALERDAFLRWALATEDGADREEIAALREEAMARHRTVQELKRGLALHESQWVLEWTATGCQWTQGCDLQVALVQASAELLRDPQGPARVAHALQAQGLEPGEWPTQAEATAAVLRAANRPWPGIAPDFF
jgi:hypothetical protein